jgi:hypothetical protein
VVCFCWIYPAIPAGKDMDFVTESVAELLHQGEISPLLADF